MPWTVSDVDEHKEGLTARQKRQWVRIANSVRRDCLDEGNSESYCDGLAIRQANGSVGNNNMTTKQRTTAQYKETTTPQSSHYTTTVRQHQGENHIVVPVIMMVEGVHCGSHGPLLHLGQDLGRFPGAWNGIPVVVNHPEENGVGVSANSPDIVDEQVVGRVYSTRFEDGKLRAEAWINENKASQVSPEVLTYLRSGRPLDVSLGVFTEDEPTSGEFNGEEYSAIARNHRPDHLALLPGAQGACSWEDGCGVRANKDGSEGGEHLTEENQFDPIKAMKEYARQGHFLQTNEQGYRELASVIQSKLDAMDSDIRVHFLEELYEDYFIYRISREDGGASQNTLYKRSYSANEDGTVEFGEDTTPVVKKVEYVEQQTQMKRTKDNKGGDKVMANKDTKGCCPEKVELLIQSENNSFGEDEREWLSGLDQAQIEKLEAMEQAIETNKNKEPEKGEEPQMNKEQAVQVLKEQLSDPNQFLQLLPEEHRASVEHGMRLHNEHRQGLMTHITKNTDVYTEEELKERKTDDLEKLAKAIKPKTDYSVFGGDGTGTYQQQGQEQILPPPGVKAAE